jgi:hypothetical protein
MSGRLAREDSFPSLQASQPIINNLLTPFSLRFVVNLTRVPVQADPNGRDASNSTSKERAKPACRRVSLVGGSRPHIGPARRTNCIDARLRRLGMGHSMSRGSSKALSCPQQASCRSAHGELTVVPSELTWLPSLKDPPQQDCISLKQLVQRCLSVLSSPLAEATCHVRGWLQHQRWYRWPRNPPSTKCGQQDDVCLGVHAQKQGTSC